MKSRKNPYTKGAEALLRQIDSFRNSIKHRRLDGFAFENNSFEILDPYEDSASGVVFTESSALNPFLINIVKTAILIEATIDQIFKEKVFDRLEIVFIPTASKLVSFSEDNHTLTLNSTSLLSTKELCVYVAFEVLREYLTHIDVILFNKSASMIEFERFEPQELAHTFYGYGNFRPIPLPKKEIEDFASNCVVDILAFRKDEDRLHFDDILSIVDNVEKLELNGFGYPLIQFLIAAASTDINPETSWRQGLWRSLTFSPNASPKIELSAFKPEFFQTNWGQGLFIENFYARQQLGAFLALLGCVLADSDKTSAFKTSGHVRLVLTRTEEPQADDAPDFSFQLLKGDHITFEIEFLRDMRDLFLNSQSIKKLLNRVLAYVAQEDSRFINVNLDTYNTQIKSLISDLERVDFGPYLFKTELPELSRELTNSPYCNAFYSLVLHASVGIWMSPKNAQGVRDEFEREIYAEESESDMRFGFSMFGRGLKRIQLNPILADFLFFEDSDSGILISTKEQYIQIGYYLLLIGTLLNQLADATSKEYASVQIDFSKEQNDLFKWDYPILLSNNRVVLDSTNTKLGTPLTVDQIENLAILPRLRITFCDINEFQSIFFNEQAFTEFQTQLIKFLAPCFKNNPIPAFQAKPIIDQINPNFILTKQQTPKKQIGIIRWFKNSFEDLVLRTITQERTHEVLLTQTNELFNFLMIRISPLIIADIGLEALNDNDESTKNIVRQLLSNFKEMLQKLSSQLVFERLSALCESQEQSLNTQLQNLNASRIGKQQIELLDIEKEHQILVDKKKVLREVKTNLIKFIDFVRTLESAIPQQEIPKGTDELVLEIESEISEAPFEIDLSVDDLFDLPPFDDIDEDLFAERSTPIPLKTFLKPELIKASKCFEVSARSVASQIDETILPDSSSAAAVDCMKLGELRAHVRSIRNKVVQLPQRIHISLPKIKYCFEFSDGNKISGSRSTDGNEALITIKVPQTLDLSDPLIELDILDKISVHLGRVIEEFDLLDDGDELDHFDIKDILLVL